MKLSIKRGMTLMDPIPIGVRADGTVATEIVCRPSGGIHKLISGQTGSGKTWGEKPVLLTCAALQADQILIDTVKGLQSYASVAGALQVYETDPGRARKLLNRLVSHVLPGRTNHLTREGLTEWDPKRSSLRFLTVHIEEAWKLADAKSLVALGNALRSAGGRLVVSLQQPTYDQMDTTLRNQMGAYRAYGLADADYNQFSLPDDVINAGANPAQWGNEHPGMHYCIMPGMKTKEKVLPVRAYADGTGENTFTNAAAYVASRLGPMCPVTAAALGELWETNIPPLELVKRMGVITPGPLTAAALTPPVVMRLAAVELTPASGAARPSDDDGMGEEELESFEAVLSEDGTHVTITGDDGDEFIIELDGMDDEDCADLDEPEHPLVTRMLGDPPKDGISPEEFQELVTTLVDEFLTSGREVLARRDFINIAGDCGWSEQSFYKYLDRDERIVKADRGWIRVAA